MTNGVEGNSRRRPPRRGQRRNAVRDEGAATVIALQADLATRNGVEQLLERVRAKREPLTNVAINAGVGVAGSMKNKAQAAAGKVLPYERIAQAHGKLSEPGSGDSG